MISVRATFSDNRRIPICYNVVADRAWSTVLLDPYSLVSFPKNENLFEQDSKPRTP